jgi:predicted DNA-binding protein (MmcQ/YjbR family)
MTYQELCAYLLRHPGAFKEDPLGTDILAFKLQDRIFALLAWQKYPMELTLKCKISTGSRFTNRYSAILPGIPNNQTQWITILIDDTVPLSTLLDLIDESYELILRSLKKSIREKLQLEIV